MRITRLLFSFQGRISRLPFWLFTVASGLVVYFGGEAIAYSADLPLRTGMELAAMIVLLPALAVQTKRWHDRGKSAWWLLVNFVPIVGPLWVLVECGALEGTRGPNVHGDDPLARPAPPDTTAATGASSD